MKQISFFAIFFLTFFNVFSQIDSTKVKTSQDSTKAYIATDSTAKFLPVDSLKISKIDTAFLNHHSPNRAAIYSAILPGWGQFYNRKYWKIPVIYGVMTSLFLLSDFENKQYNRYLTALKAVSDKDSTTIDEFKGRRSASQLTEYKNFYRRNRDLCYIGMFVAYVFNIVDAGVDAHLMTFDISEDLALKVYPISNPEFRFATGIGVCFQFRSLRNKQFLPQKP